jgi:hypothetical protein
MQACEQGHETAGREAKNGHEKTVCIGQSESQECEKTPDSPAIDARVGPGLGTLQQTGLITFGVSVSTELRRSARRKETSAH